MVPAAVLILAGPGHAERERVLDGLDALAAHEPALPRETLIVDDDRSRHRAAWPTGVSVIANPRSGRGIGTLGGTVAGTLAGLAFLHRHAPGAWVLRLDADALVVGPVAERVAAAWRPADGVLGSCSRTCTGERRDVSGWAAEIRRHERPVWAWRRPPRRPAWVRPADPFVRGVLAEARRAGYAPGEHCVAAGCALSAPLVAALAARGWLERPERWLGARLGDDIVLGAMSRGCGLSLRDLPSVFGIRHVGLPADPAALRERGFGVVHSTRNDPVHDEASVRAFFAGERA